MLLFPGKSLQEWKSQPYDVEISLYNTVDASKWKFFYDTLMCISNTLEDRAARLARDIVQTNKLPEPIPFDHCGLEVMTFQGKVLPYDKSKVAKQLNTIKIQGMGDMIQILKPSNLHRVGKVIHISNDCSRFI